jgi:chemotaxis protein methyltransferase CheR
MTSPSRNTARSPVSSSGVEGALDRATFERIRDIVYDGSGIVLKEDKATLMAGRLGRRLRELRIATARDYLGYLQGEQGTDEVPHLLDAISTNVTFFFREADHFDLVAQLHSRWVEAGQTRFRYWCAGSSSGEEPYTLAMTLHALGAAKLDLRILATDISTAILERALVGEYPERAVAEIPKRILTRYFHRDVSAGEPLYVVGDDLRQMIAFRHQNLVHLPLPLNGPLDLIMCRNVMIYFDHALRSRLVSEFARILKPGGCLLVSQSESLVGVDCELQMVRPSLYVKPGGAERAG